MLFEILNEAMTVYHSTSKEGLANINKQGFQAQANDKRLFPASVSFTLRPNSFGGKHSIKTKLDVQDNDILRLTMKEFWSKTKENEEVTPIELGKRWAKEAIANGKKVIIIKGVPEIGTEVCVLDVSVIAPTTKRMD